MKTPQVFTAHSLSPPSISSMADEAVQELKPASEEEVKTKTPKAHFVLVHGIGSGAWCWYKIRCLLEKSGYTVSCPDLKSAGIDSTEPNSIESFQDYNQPLIDLLSSLPDNQKVILVGHSAGGVSVTDAIHRFGKKISVAVFVGATMLKQGFLTEEDKKDGVPDLSEFGDIYEPPKYTMRREFLPIIPFNMSPEEDVTLVWMLSKAGPFEVISNAKFDETCGIDEVTRLYVKTLHDHVMKLEQQEAMIKKWPPVEVFTLESDHCPNLSAPFELFQILVKAADIY